MPKTKIADGELHHESTGSGAPLIFVSGLNGLARYWQPQIGVFAERFRVIAYDQRGTGESDRLQRTFSVDGFAADLVGLMDALGIESAHIVGLSTGGAIGQTLAVTQPQRVNRLVMCSTWTHCDPWFRRLFEARRAMYQTAGSALHAMFHPLWLYPPDYVNAHDGEIDEERKRSAGSAPPVEISVGRIDALMKFDRRAGLRNIRSPTLIIASDNDYITPSYYAKTLVESIPGAQLEIVQGGGHSISKTRTDAFNRLVLSFLTAA